METSTSHEGTGPVPRFGRIPGGRAEPALLAAAWTVAVTEAARTAWVAAHVVPLGAALGGGAVTFGLVATPLFALTFALGIALRPSNVRSFALGAPSLLAGGTTRTHVHVGFFLFASCAGAASLTATWVGRRAFDTTSAAAAAATAAVASIATLVVAGLAAAAVGPSLAARAAEVESEIGVKATRATVLGAGIVLVIGALARLLPREIGADCVACVVAMTIESSLHVVAPLVRGRRAWRRALGLAAASVAFPAFTWCTPTVRLVVLQASPLAAGALAMARTLADTDRDGYASILGGGDCNDHDATIHPGAYDVPGNGVDENCSGADAVPFTPPRQPPYAHPQGLPEHPNVVLVQLDALRPDHLGFAGYARPTSPNLDRFRREATWFRRAYTPAPSTRFAVPAVFTGADVQRIPQRRGPGLDFEMLPGLPTIAGRLDEVGYDRIGFTISYVLQHIKGVGQGFRRWETPWPDDAWKENYPVSATKTTDSAIRTLADLPDDGSKPYFLFLHYRCTHDPYASDPRWSFGTRPSDAYDSAIAYCDDELGRLLRAADSRRDAGRTVTIVFSDHGELFGEHGLEYHGNSLFEPDVRALLLARLPHSAGATIDEPVSITDIHPTILELAGLERGREVRGWSLLPALRYGAAAGLGQRPLYLYADLVRGALHLEARAVVLGRYKYLHDLTAGTKALFDVETDPAETRDLGPILPGERAALDELLESWEGASLQRR